jgi:hypothetical protein
VKKSWLNLATGLALLAGNGLVLAQDAAPPAPVEPTPAPAPVQPQGLRPIPDVMDSTALGFRRLNAARSFENAERTTVRLVRNARIVQTRRVGVGGVAQMSEVSPGAYSVFATGSEGFAAYSIYLGDGAFSSSSSVGLVPRQDMGPVLEAIRTYTQGSAAPTPAAAAANVAKNLDRITEHGDFELHADGSVKGQVVKAAPRSEAKQALPGMHVSFIREGQVVANATTDQDGGFSIPGLEPGIFSFVVAGSEGFATFAVGAVRPVEQAQARTRRFEFVAAAVQTPVVTICPVPGSDFSLLNVLANANGSSNGRAPSAPMAGNGGGGAGGGGGGGAAGGGGFGGLLGAAAAGAAIGAAAANNDNPSTP